MKSNENDNAGVDLSGMIKSPNPKSQKEQYAPNQATPSTNLKFIRLVMNHSGGLLKDEKQSESAILGFVILAILFSLISILNTVRTPSPPPPEQIIQIAGPGLSP
jgi:hypothetical protein